MGYDHTKRVWQDTQLKGGKLLVMLALAHHAAPDSTCYPGLPLLAKESRLTDRQVRRVLNELEKSGHIVIEERAIGRGKKPSYRLFPEKADILSQDAKESGQNVTGKEEEMSRVDVKADILDTKSGHLDTIKADISDADYSHVRSESHLRTPIELTEEKEEAHAGDPLSVAWRQVYADVPMPPKLTKSLQELVIECGMAATIHGIKASAKKEGGRNFKYIAECARNYVPPPPMVTYARGNVYSMDVPGIVPLPAAPIPAPIPEPPPPMAHSDPWAICVAELAQGFASTSAGRWMNGSRLEPNGELAGVPFYRVVLTERGADALWMTQQAEPAIRKKLASLLGKRIQIEIVTEQRVTI